VNSLGQGDEPCVPFGPGSLTLIHPVYHLIREESPDQCLVAGPLTRAISKHKLTFQETCGFLNLYIAGDWTLNGFNAGCVEAAVTSGLMACRALCGSPKTIVGEPGREF